MKKYIAAMIVTVASFVGVMSATTQSASAINVFKNCNGSSSVVCAETKAGGSKTSSLVQSIINLLLYAVGIISVIMIIVGGIKYTTSNGDASKITSAKNTILYAVVGLVVAIMSFAIVNLVVSRIA